MKKPNACLKQNRRFKTTELSKWLQSCKELFYHHRPDEPLSSLHAIIAHVLKKPTHFALAHPEFMLTFEQKEKLDRLSNQLVSGVPLPYLIGNQEFYGIEFFVTPDVLIPRPETELMIDAFNEWQKNSSIAQEIADVGTGSGCIGVTLSKLHPALRIIATDISFSALQVASINSKKHIPNEKITFLNADLLSGIETQFDCICANLPYIPSKRLRNLKVSAYEPDIALDGGRDGLDLISRLLHQSSCRLRTGGALMVEIDHSQVEKIRQLATQLFNLTSIKIIKDYADFPRVMILQM